MKFLHRREMARRLAKCVVKSTMKSVDRRWWVAIAATATAAVAGATAFTALKARSRS